MMPLLVPEVRKPRWSIERLSAVIGIAVALAVLAAVLLVTATVGAEPMRLPSWSRQSCDGSLLLHRADGTPPPARGCHVVKAL